VTTAGNVQRIREEPAGVKAQSRSLFKGSGASSLFLHHLECDFCRDAVFGEPSSSPGFLAPLYGFLSLREMFFFLLLPCEQLCGVEDVLCGASLKEETWFLGWCAGCCCGLCWVVQGAAWRDG